MRLHKIQAAKIFIVSSKEVYCQLLLTITCNVSSNQFDLCTAVYHICILYKS